MTLLSWDITRASAFVALVCYTITVAWGIALTARSFRPPVAPQFDYHRFVSVLGLAALVTHVTSLLVDRYSGIHIGTLLGVRASAVVLPGVVAFWLVVALPFSFRAKGRKWISQPVWRAFHYAGYAVFGLAILHGVTAGTDTGQPWTLAIYGTCGASVGAVAWWRFVDAPRAAKARRAAKEHQAAAGTAVRTPADAAATAEPPPASDGIAA